MLRRWWVLEAFLQNLANGISLGSLYALTAIGYTMVYGVLRLINFAHGDVFMVGAYIALFGIARVALPWWGSFALAAALTAVLGVIVERVAYRPLRDAPRISALISAIGVSLLLENVGLVVIGGRPLAFPIPAPFRSVYRIGHVAIPAVSLYITAISVGLMLALLWLVYHTKPGLAMRAMSRDFETARLMAIDVNRIVALTFAIGSALAAAGGIMWSLKFPQVHPLMGILPGLKAFIAAVLGGIGNIPGAVLGGVCLGIAEIMLVAAFPGLSGYRDAIAFLILVLVLLGRPWGLLGEKEVVKV